MKRLLLLCFLFYYSPLLGQHDFSCQIEKKDISFISPPPGYPPTAYDHGPNRVVSMIDDSSFLLKDTLGNLLLTDTLLYCGSDSRRNIMTIQNKRGDWGILRPDLSVFLDVKYEDLAYEAVGSGFNCFVKKDGRWGLVDSNATQVLPIEFDDVRLLEYNVARLEKSDSSFLFFFDQKRLIDISGYCVNLGYWSPHREFFLIRDGTSIGVMSKDGKVILKPIYDQVRLIQENEEQPAKFFILTEGGQYGLANQQGQVVLPLSYRKITPLAEPYNKGNDVFILTADQQQLQLWVRGKVLAPIFQGINQIFVKQKRPALVVQTLNRFGLYDYEREQYTLPPKFDEIGLLADTFLYVNYRGRFGIYSQAGQKKIGHKYDTKPKQHFKSEAYPKGYFKVQKKGQIGILSFELRVLLPTKYHIIHSLSKGRRAIMRNHKWGYLNTDFKKVIPLIYDQVNRFQDGMAQVKKGNDIFYIDQTGNCIIDCPKGPK